MPNRIKQPCVVALLAIFSIALSQQLPAQKSADTPVPEITKASAIESGVEQLLKIQNEDGAWPYEGVYRVRRKIPVGYRIGGTAICCEALLYATDGQNKKATQAIENGVRLILKELEHPLMVESTENRYDVRVWGHIYALDLFCRLKDSKRLDDELKPLTEDWISKLTKTLIAEEIEGGGWNYANQRSHAGFVTAPAVQALAWANQLGEDVPDEVFQRAADALISSRNTNGAFSYSGKERDARPSKIPSSIARSTNCETTLSLLGLDRENAIENALADFHQYWDELEVRRKQTGTHVPPYGIAPYYFYYAHRFAAQAIQQLPEDKRAAQYEKLFALLKKTRDPDGTWNDRVFDRSRAYGTAMAVLALLEDKVPFPKRFVLTVNLGPSGEPSGVLREPVKGFNLKPDLKLKIRDDATIEIRGQELLIVNLEQWLADNPIQPKPTVVLIEADGNTRTGVVESVKKTLENQLPGGFSLFVKVLED